MLPSPRAQHWAHLVTALDRSNVSLREFADRHDVNPSTLAWWRWRLRVSGSSVGFVQVPLPERPRAASSLRVEIVERGLCVVVPHDADLDRLRSVVDALS